MSGGPTTPSPPTASPGRSPGSWSPSTEGAAGTVAASAARPIRRESVAQVVRAADEAALTAARSGRAKDAQPLIQPSRRDNGFRRTAGTDVIRCLRRIAGFAGRGLCRGQIQRAHPLWICPARVEYGPSRLLHWTAVAVGAANRSAGGQREVRRPATIGLGRVVDRGLPRCPGRQVADDLATRLEWARRTIDLPPGRYDTVLPPTAVADFMLSAVLECRRPAGTRGPIGVLRGRRWHPAGRAADRPAVHPVQRPGGRRLWVDTVCGHRAFRR